MYKEFVYSSNLVYPTGYIAYIVTKIQRWRYMKWRYKKKKLEYMLETILFSKFKKFLFSIKRYIVNYILRRYLSPKVYTTLRGWLANRTY